ncbi:2629_t:CDS:2 [Funneliformis caledonium]|uniref:2629_t:CDS:1 n=1 Tax=Funneliformis caledonium TaxID=1117310 RepID=A0A9N9FB52_9GLOM|nr:2629_t:CDS:2 [Funneliformis caledonium]
MAWQRSVIKFLVVSLGKKILVLGIAKVCSLAEYQVQMYGIPHVYRRALEINKKVFKNPETRKITANLVKRGFLLPNTISVRLGMIPQRPIKTFPSSSSATNNTGKSNTITTPYTPSRLIKPSLPNLPIGSIKNPTTSTPITQTTTTTSTTTPTTTPTTTSTTTPTTTSTTTPTTTSTTTSTTTPTSSTNNSASSTSQK